MLHCYIRVGMQTLNRARRRTTGGKSTPCLAQVLHSSITIFYRARHRITDGGPTICLAKVYIAAPQAVFAVGKSISTLFFVT